MNKKVFIRLLIGLLAVVLLVSGLQLIYIAYQKYKLETNHVKVRDYIATELTFDQDDLDEQLSVLEKWMENDFLYPEDYGLVYERASNIYKFRDDYANYARCYGYAMYYLEQSDDVDDSVNLSLDLAMFCTVNNNYDLARDIVDHMLENTDIDKLQSAQVKSYLHRFLGVLSIYEGDYEEGERQLRIADAILEEDPEGGYIYAYHAINSVVLAKAYYYQGRYDEAESLLDAYDDSELFVRQEYASISARDFIIPYYESRIYIALKTGEDISSYLDAYVEVCDAYGYEQWKLSTLINIRKEFGYLVSEEYREIDGMLKDAYLDAATSQGTRYTNLINGIIQDSYNHIKQNYDMEKRLRARLFIYLMLIILAVWITIFIICFVKNSRLDGLTRIGSRGAFDSEMAKIKHDYGIIMIDIDNFKKVNDTYGHQKGDEVLQRLGQMLSDMKSSHIHPFRYGGEEFVLIVHMRSLQSVANIAEHVRKIFEAQEWDFGAKLTISLGCAVSTDGRDVVKRADENLYVSKKNGKNRVTS